jgi:heme/copper-type cytochrome/quinol oxidase subunit 2
MDQDTTQNDSTENRPLPKWLTDQRDGLNQFQPEIKVMKEDRSLNISIMITGATILLAVAVLTIYILRKNRKHGNTTPG